MNDTKVYTRSELNKLLYNVARNIVGGQTDNEGEAVRLVRARLCRDATALTRGKTRAIGNYKDLSETELGAAIRLGEEEYKTNGHPASTKQLRFLASMAIQSALYETDMNDYLYETSIGPLAGNELLSHMRLVNSASKLPKEIFQELCKRWINPTLNSWLAQGGFRKQPSDASMFFMNSLSTKEASYLIGRMQKAKEVRTRNSVHNLVTTTN